MKRKDNTSLLKKIVKLTPAMIGVTALVYIGVLIKDVEIPVILPVKHVEVSGDLRFLDAGEIRSLALAQIDGGYFTVNLKQVRDELLRQPWVKNVSLRRTWPASVSVNVEEREPVAYWNNDAYLSKEGHVFKPEKIDHNLNLPKLNGTHDLHEKVWKFMNVLYKETALLNYEVVSLNLDERRAWQMTIASQTVPTQEVAAQRITVRLGRFETQKRMQRFVRILPALTATNITTTNGVNVNDIEVIDMRYPNGFAVKMKETNLENITKYTVKGQLMAIIKQQMHELEA